MHTSGPFISADRKLPEITLKAILLSILLTVLLGSANAYLGLKVGTTITASIPAAIIAMGILRFFKKHNVLETNIIQTAASCGEALIAGVVFTLPAMIVVGAWQSFSFLQTSLIALIGGILGVIFSVPIRRVLLSDQSLPFPEGRAIGQVLIASSEQATGLKYLVWGGLGSAAISFAQIGLKVVSSAYQYWYQLNNVVIGAGLGFNPAMLAAGYIVGVEVAMSIVVGVLVGWILGVPILSYWHPQSLTANVAAQTLWQQNIRYIGVGTMLVGGLWTLITLLKPIAKGLHASYSAMKNHKGQVKQLRTEQDIPFNLMAVGAVVMGGMMTVLFYHLIQHYLVALSQGQAISLALGISVFLLFAGFFFSSVCGYFAGLVGSTNNPVSGMTLAALVIGSLLLLWFLTQTAHFEQQGNAAKAAAAIAIIIAAIVAGASAISCDTIQDLKAGQMVGATPWKQQIMLLFGVVITSIVVAPIMQLLYQAYGIAGVFPRPGMDPTQMLAAPQAGLMAAVAQAVFQNDLPWKMIGVGALIAVVTLVTDKILKKQAMRLPVLAVGLGIYLPLDASMPLVLGGILSWLVHRQRPSKTGQQHGLLLACGMVAGASLVGVILAVPFVLAGSSDVLALQKGTTVVSSAMGFLAAILILVSLYRVSTQKIR